MRAAATNCPVGYKDCHNGVCLKLFKNQVIWDEARQSCKEEGARLFAPHDRDSNKCAKDLVKEKDDIFKDGVQLFECTAYL